MAEDNTLDLKAAEMSAAARQRVEELIEEEEGAQNKYRGVLAVVLSVCAIMMSLFHLYAAVEIVPAYILRPVHVAFGLALVFLVFPVAKRFRHRLMWWDVLFAILSIAVVVYILYSGDEFGDRAVDFIDLGGKSPQFRVDIASDCEWVSGLCLARFAFASTVDA